MFKDRTDAGQKLITALQQYLRAKDTTVLGLARGGVPVAAVVAKGLSLPLSVVVPRKLGAPGNKELAIGALAEEEVVHLNEPLIQMLNVPESYLKKEIEHQRSIENERLALFRTYCPLPSLKKGQVLLIDDGIATGATMLAAIESMRKLGVKKVIVAVPTASASAYALLQKKADAIISLIVDDDFQAVGQYYERFDQTDDTEVVDIIKNF